MFLDTDRVSSRRERYDKKKNSAVELPLAIAVISFDFDDNVAFLIRSAACFGASEIFIIGKVPDRSFLNSKSGSLYDYVTIKSFSNTLEFTRFARESGYKIVAIELCETATSLYNYSFSMDKKTILLLGNETTGIPGDIVLRHDTVYIPMLGPGYCLNASQAGTIVMNEFCRQYMKSNLPLLSAC